MSRKIFFCLSILITLNSVSSQECITYDFEEDYETEFFGQFGVLCSAIPTIFNLGSYSSVGIESPDALSSNFIYPSVETSCVSSSMYSVAAGGVVEVNVYFDSNVANDQLVVFVNQESGTVAGQLPVSPSTYDPGWQALRITLLGTGTFNAYISFMGQANEESRILIDSFRYISPNYDETECVIYSDEEPVITTPTTEEPEITTITTEEPEITTTTEEPEITTPTTEEPEITTITTEEPEITTTTTEEPEITTTTEEPVTTTTPTEEPEITTITTEEPEIATTTEEPVTTTTPTEEPEITTITTEEPEITTTTEEQEITTTTTEEPEITTITTEEPEITTTTTEEPEITTPTTEEPEITTTTTEEPEITITTEEQDITTTTPEEPEITTPTTEESEITTSTTAPEEEDITDENSKSTFYIVVVSLIAAGSLLVLALICSCCYELGKWQAAKNAPIIDYDIFNEDPPQIIPRVTRIYPDVNKILV